MVIDHLPRIGANVDLIAFLIVSSGDNLGQRSRTTPFTVLAHEASQFLGKEYKQAGVLQETRAPGTGRPPSRGEGSLAVVDQIVVDELFSGQHLQRRDP
jgi:hypothetical protein